MEVERFMVEVRRYIVVIYRWSMFIGIVILVLRLLAPTILLLPAFLWLPTHVPAF
jgi:hypothetical protein